MFAPLAGCCPLATSLALSSHRCQSPNNVTLVLINQPLLISISKNIRYYLIKSTMIGMPFWTQAIPFVYELRALLDWSCTATTLSLFDWFKLEDINASLF